MNKTIGKRSWLGSLDIGAIELNAKSRDDIPAILFGLQAIYIDEKMRNKLFGLLDEHIPGRLGNTDSPGMDLWRILVMGVLKQGLQCDVHHLQELVNNFSNVQAFLGHDAWFDPGHYELRTIRENVGLLTPELLRRVGEMVSATGHKVARKFAWRNVRRAQ